MTPRLHARSGERERTASGLLAEALDRFAEPAGRILVVDDHEGLAEEVATVRGGDGARVWRRWAWRLAPEPARARVHAVEPPPGPFEVVALRLPRDWPSFEMQVHLAAARLVRGGVLLVVGGNDEGIRSAPRRLGELFDETVVVVNRRRMRVLRASGLRADAKILGDVEAWRTVASCAGLPAVTYPGVFAKGRLDAGSALLLDALDDADVPERVLDFGCGHGVLSRVLASRGAGSAFTLLDVDALALHAAAQNLPDARTVLSDGWEGLAQEDRFDLVVSNPPIHRGRDEDFSVLQDLVREAPERLARRGRLVLVVQRTVGAGRLLRAHLPKARKLAESTGYQVWEGRV